MVKRTHFSCRQPGSSSPNSRPSSHSGLPLQLKTLPSLQALHLRAADVDTNTHTQLKGEKCILETKQIRGQRDGLAVGSVSYSSTGPDFRPNTCIRQRLGPGTSVPGNLTAEESIQRCIHRHGYVHIIKRK